MKKYLFLIILLAFLVGCNTEKEINNFEECINAGNPAMESYPRQCSANGITFVEQIPLENQCQLKKGKWLESSKECEDISEEDCKELGGMFDACTSACRNDPEAEVCTMQCVPVCSFEKPIGGERDEDGCLGTAGYVWDGEIGACIRNWELEGEQRKAAKIAVTSIGKIKGLTVVEVEVSDCEGCFMVQITDPHMKQIDVNLENWEVVENECSTDSDCTTAGCSGIICQSKDVEPMSSICVYLPEYECYDDIGCGCIEGKCAWDETEEFNDCVELARE